MISKEIIAWFLCDRHCSKQFIYTDDLTLQPTSVGEDHCPNFILYFKFFECFFPLLMPLTTMGQ